MSEKEIKIQLEDLFSNFAVLHQNINEKVKAEEKERLEKARKEMKNQSKFQDAPIEVLEQVVVETTNRALDGEKKEVAPGCSVIQPETSGIGTSYRSNHVLNSMIGKRFNVLGWSHGKLRAAINCSLNTELREACR